MRPAVLSIATERVVSPIRNAVLAHAGYGVIPATSTEYALQVLRGRHVCALVVGHSISGNDRLTLCQEAQRMGVSSVVLDPYDLEAGDQSELHVNPLDGPEVFLQAVATQVARSQPCIGSQQQ